MLLFIYHVVLSYSTFSPSIIAVATLSVVVYIAWFLPSNVDDTVYTRTIWKEVSHLFQPVEKVVDWGYWHAHRNLQKPFNVKYWGHRYRIMPMEYLHEIRNASVDRLSCIEAVNDNGFVSFWTSDVFSSGHMASIVRTGLNRDLSAATGVAIRELTSSMHQSFGSNQGQSKVVVLSSEIRDVSTRALTCLTVGKSLADNPQFTDGVANYILYLFIASFGLVLFPWPALQAQLCKPLIWLQASNKRRLIAAVQAEVDKRKAHRANGRRERSDVDLVDHTFDFVERQYARKGSEPDLTALTTELIHNIQAGVAGMSNFCVQGLYQILGRPEYLQQLRVEAEASLRRHGWSSHLIEDLPLLNSFVREIMRFYPMFTLNCNRLVKNVPFVFSDGHELPVGTRIAFPTGPASHDPVTSGLDDADEFDGFRWARMAAADKAAGRLGISRNAMTASLDNSTFGIGSHACPGRFIGIRICMIIITKLLLEYDLSWDRGQKGIPDRWRLQGIAVANPFQKVTFIRR